MATILRRRPARRNNGNKIVAHTAASMPIQAVGKLPLKATTVEGSGHSDENRSSCGSNSTQNNSSIESQVNSSRRIGGYVCDQKICGTCACPAACCLCSTSYRTCKGGQWTDKMNAAGRRDDSSSSAGSETPFKAAGWGPNEPLFIAAAATLTALQALILALQSVTGRSWAEKALEAQANACMFWVQAAAHAVPSGNWRLGLTQTENLSSSPKDAFHDAEILLALPNCDIEQKSEGQDKRRKRNASKLLESKQGWQPCLSFSPTLSSSPSGSSGFSFVQGDDLDEPSTLQSSTLEILVKDFGGSSAPVVSSQPATPEKAGCNSEGNVIAKDGVPPFTSVSVEPLSGQPISSSATVAAAGKCEVKTVGEGTKDVKTSCQASNLGESATGKKESLFPPLGNMKSDKQAESLSKKQKRKMKKKSNQQASSMTSTPRTATGSRPSSAV